MPAPKPPQRYGNHDPEQKEQRQSNAVMTVELQFGLEIAQGCIMKAPAAKARVAGNHTSSERYGAAPATKVNATAAHNSAKRTPAIHRTEDNQPRDAITVSMRSASSGLCNKIMRKTPTPAAPASTGALNRTAPGATQSTIVWTQSPTNNPKAPIACSGSWA